MIPVGGIVGTRKDNILLCGDAAGQCNPITGAGISNAVLCGSLAGEIAAKAVIDDNLDILSEYDEAVEELVAHSINHAVEKRRHLVDNWGSGNLSEMLKPAGLRLRDIMEMLLNKLTYFTLLLPPPVKGRGIFYSLPCGRGLG